MAFRKKARSPLALVEAVIAVYVKPIEISAADARRAEKPARIVAA